MEKEKTQNTVPTKKLKIGILTFHRAHNYGAFLQCYALQEYLKTLGHNVSVIDYDPEYFRKDYASFRLGRDFKQISLLRKIKRLVAAYILFVPRLLRYIAFEKSINKFLDLHGKRFLYADEIDFSGYDVVFFGSDQVWNPRITHGIDKCFWGDFDFHGKKIAYAASAGDDFSVLKNQIDMVKKCLSSFYSISVREKNFEEYLANIKISSKMVLDPTLLLTDSQWKIFSECKKTRRKYLVLYIMKPSVEASKIAEKIAKELNLNIKTVYAGMGVNPKSWLNAFFSPKEFVSLFYNAQFVVTTSFHGTAFSVNFRKQFYAVNNGEPNFRVESLLELLDLKNRYISTASEMRLSQKIEYSCDSLEKAREGSINFIKESVKCNGGGYKCIVNTSCAPSSFKQSSLLEAA